MKKKADDPIFAQKISFCTYFDKFYLAKGLAMHASLMRHSSWAKLWILCMDDYTFELLKRMQLKNVHLIRLGEFEDPQLLSIKNSRTDVEYYWTTTPSLPLYILRKTKGTEIICYIDADLFFYSPIEPLVQELDDKSVLIVEHRFPPKYYSRMQRSGRFNVGILLFRNDELGKKCLKEWRDQCIKWCYYRVEDGKMGDQFYLNEWPEKYRSLVISKNLGVNAAPWNIGQYTVRNENNAIYINSDKLICYHFHQFKVLGETRFSICSPYVIPWLVYPISKKVRVLLYAPYIEAMKKSLRLLRKFDTTFNYYETRALTPFF